MHPLELLKWYSPKDRFCKKKSENVTSYNVVTKSVWFIHWCEFELETLGLETLSGCNGRHGKTSENSHY